jgi:hypothetical protein
MFSFTMSHNLNEDYSYLYNMLNSAGTNDDQQPKHGIKLRRFGDLSHSYNRAKRSATVKNSLTN